MDEDGHHQDRRPCEAFPASEAHCIQLGGEELSTLRRLTDALRGREGEIAALWEQRYARAFGRRAYHTSDDFRTEAEEEIRLILRHLASGDRHGLSEWFSTRGRQLFRAGVPYSEVCRSLHLFEDSVIEVLRSGDRNTDEVLELFAALDHLSHERLILMAEAYHRACHRRWSRKEEALIREVAVRECRAGLRDRLCGMIGASERMQEVYERLTLAARSRETVLLVGETGTGKDLAARTIHALSGDPPDRFVPVNCAALSHELIESELFGHRRGAFTGAQTDHPGLFRAASGGTLFLDEVTELPPRAQAKLLRVLQERAVRPVGGLAEVPVTVRIVASTNRDLDAALAEGLVRRDLYYRLRQLVVALPPLRDRREDIPLLARHFVEKAAGDELCPRALPIGDDARDRLCRHDWPGNVRELESTVRYACQRASSGSIRAADLCPFDTGREVPTPTATPEEPISMKEAERDAIRRALNATEGNKTQAARLLGISRKRLYAKLRAFGI